jgi:hypothetical protein
MHVLDVARQNTVARQLLARRAVLATRKAWAQIDPKAIRPTWHGQVGPAVERMLTGAQAEAASLADPYLRAAMKAQGKPDSTEGMVVPEAFAGTASDGRQLSTLLELSNVYALQQIQQGAAPADGLAFAGRWLAQTVGQQVIDAARAATSVALTARPDVAGYIRVTSGACCARCAILAGRWYRWNADFERHVACQCGQVPADDGRLARDPMQLFRDGLITDLSAADRAALEDGADISQVVNAHRGVFTASGRTFTREGVTKRGVFGAQAIREGYVGIPRLTPGQIYRDATSRTDAVRLLQRFGYLT